MSAAGKAAHIPSADGPASPPDEGPTTWVLLRGLTRERAHWGGFPERLAARLPCARVLTPDLPGCGALHRERSPACIGEMVAAVRAQLAAQGVSGPVGVLALSLGGMVALDWASRWPQELRALVLVNTSLRRFSPFHHRLRPLNYPALLAAWAGVDARRREAAVLRLTSARAAELAGVVDDWARVRRLRPVSAANTLRQLWAAARYRAPALPPPVPTLVLASAGDRLVDPRCSRRLAQAWDWPLAEHPSAGHDLPLDDADWVVGQVAGQWTRWHSRRKHLVTPVA